MAHRSARSSVRAIGRRCAGPIEPPFIIRELHRAFARGARVTADEFQRLEVADLDLALVDPYQHAGADRCGARGVPTAVDLNRGVVLHGAGTFREVTEA